jgi:signal transduction histidine kinase
VIAADLIRGHGGRLELLETSENGTTFVIQLPKADLALADAAQ